MIMLVLVGDVDAAVLFAAVTMAAEPETASVANVVVVVFVVAATTQELRDELR